MSLPRSIASYNLVRSLHIKPYSRIHGFLLNQNCHLEIPQEKGGLGLLVSRSMQHLRTINRGPIDNRANRHFTVYSSVPSGAPNPSGPPPRSWRGWIWGVLVTIVLPFFTHKWGPLLNWTNEFEERVDTVEDIVDAVEVMAEKLDKAAEDISDDLPEGGKLRRAVDFIEDVAEEIDKGAELLGDIIDKVQEMGEKVESFMEQDSEVAKKPSDNKISKL